MRLGLAAAAFLLLGACGGNNTPQVPSINYGTMLHAQGKEVFLTASSTFGGAIISLNWNNFEFVDSHDYGRLIQAAYQLDNMGEDNNPTEAGQLVTTANPLSVPTATQIINESNLDSKTITTTVHPAFWHPLNGQATSADTIAKTVTVDWNGIINVTKHNIVITLAASHSICVGMNVTGYVNHSLDVLYILNTDGTITNIPNPPVNGYQTSQPTIFADSTGQHAIGAYSPHVGGQYPALINAYNSGTMDWNADWRVIQPCASGTYSSTVYYIVGTLSDVQAKMQQVIAVAP